MVKELIISFIIIVSIFIGDGVTKNYTNETVEEISKEVMELRDEIVKNREEMNMDYVNNKADEIHTNWNDRYEKLAYYIEHDELEKVETELTVLDGYLEKEEFTDIVPELDKSVFLLNHIREKTLFNLKNVF